MDHLPLVYCHLLSSLFSFSLALPPLSLPPLSFPLALPPLFSSSYCSSSFSTPSAFFFFLLSSPPPSHLLLSSSHFSLSPSLPPSHSLSLSSSLPLPLPLFLPPTRPLSPSLHVPFLSQIENIIRHDLAARFDRCQQDMIKALWQKERRFPQMYNLKPEIAFHGTLSKSLPSIGEIVASPRYQASEIAA